MRLHGLKRWMIGLGVLWLAVGLGDSARAQMLFDGDGSTEEGFVPPPQKPPPPPKPPGQASSGESFSPFPCPPVTPQSRSEKKNPPNPPVMFTKLTSSHGPMDWASRPNDLNNLMKSMKEMIDVNFSCDVKSFNEVDPDPEKNPILYRSSHFNLTMTAAERQKLRDYLLNGGMIIMNPGMGSKPFYNTARKELQLTFPEVQVQRLSPDHPIFHSYYTLDRVGYRKAVREAGYRGDEPWFEGVTINCRVVAVISRWGMDIGWDPVEDESLLGYSVESAKQLGVNLLAYATAQRAWAKNAVKSMQFIDETPVSAGKMAIAQVIYDGEWKTRHAALSVLLKEFNQKTEVPVKFDRTELKLSDPRIFDSPILYLTGHEDFRLQPAEINNLRDYLNKGGLLFAEACCGRSAFDRAFRSEINKVLPGQGLKPIAPGAFLFSQPNKIGRLGVTPALGQHLGRSAIEPNLLGIEKDGHYQVIFSPYGMAGGWELSQNPYAHGYEDAGAIALGENILFYAITQ